MARNIEYEEMEIDFDIVAELDEEEEVVELEDEIESTPETTSRKKLYAQSVVGMLAMVTIFIIPFVTVPGMFIFVLIAEVYLIDWTYSKAILLYNFRSFSSKRITISTSGSEIENRAKLDHRHQYFK